RFSLNLREPLPLPWREAVLGGGSRPHTRCTRSHTPGEGVKGSPPEAGRGNRKLRLPVRAAGRECIAVGVSVPRTTVRNRGADDTPPGVTYTKVMKPAEDLRAIYDLLPPESIPINSPAPTRGTPLANERPVDSFC